MGNFIHSFSIVALTLLYNRLQLCRGHWRVRDGVLVAELDLLRLEPNGTLPIPQGTRRVFIEVGAGGPSLADSMELFPDAFVLSFEPVMHKYASHLARQDATDPQSMHPLGKHAPRGLLLPFAVSPSQNRTATLTTGGTDQACSSLLPPRLARDRISCANPQQIEQRKVPSVSLNTVLGSWLAWQGGGGWPIDFLQIDAEGFDVDVLLSANKDLMQRIQRVQLEVPADSCERMFDGAWACSEIMAMLNTLGFVEAYNRSCEDFTSCYQDDFEFVRPGVEALHQNILPWMDECWIGQGFQQEHWQHFCCNTASRVGMLYSTCWNTMYIPWRCCSCYTRGDGNQICHKGAKSFQALTGLVS